MTTQVQKIKKVEMTDEELKALLDSPGLVSAENIIVPEKTVKSNLFSREDAGAKILDNLDNEEEEEEEEEEETPEVKKPVVTNGENTLSDAEQKKALEVLDNHEEIENEDGETKKKVSKNSSMYKLFSKMITEGKLVPFEGEEIENYTTEDYRELLEANEKRKLEEVVNDVPAQFFQSLPPELQHAYRYINDGGQDLKGLFRALAQVEEIREIDIETEEGQEDACRNYLHATNYGSVEDIEEEIAGWKNRGELETKAEKFKPKLDKMNEQLIAQKLDAQAVAKKQSEQASKKYAETVYQALAPGDLGGIKIDRKIQEMLWTGLTNKSIPAKNGTTNMLGHLLEKYQFVEPNPQKILKALWILMDEEGYEKKLLAKGGSENAEKTVRILKTEQGNKKSGTQTNEHFEDASRKTANKTMQRPKNSFFKRNN